MSVCILNSFARLPIKQSCCYEFYPTDLEKAPIWILPYCHISMTKEWYRMAQAKVRHEKLYYGKKEKKEISQEMVSPIQSFTN